LISSLTLGIVYFKVAGAIFPLIIAGCGLLASILGTFLVKGDEKANPHKALKMGYYASSVIVLIVAFIFSKYFFGDFNAAIAIVAGLIVGLLIGIITEV
ncbi:sodium/proton-translocating pyrophosphatase, partial [Clostridium sp. SL.3.18]|nr:sodium/proton-translocating pyrophosphatase [Clostridium sp. SL.3.18]